MRRVTAWTLGAVLTMSMLAAPVTAENVNAGMTPPFISLDEVKQGWRAAEATAAPPRVDVRGIYLSAWIAKQEAAFRPLVDLVDRTELNAFVIDVKDDSGYISIDMNSDAAAELGAISPQITDMKAFMADLKAKNIYTIARVVTFKDSLASRLRPDQAVASVHGGIWRDFNGVSWLNPYDRASWDYVVEIARETALAGFDEIQFDYVRFPTDGDLSAIRYPGKDDRPREQVIADFLAYARKELRPYRVWVSADVFGLVTSTADDMGIGQRLEEISAAVDYVSPMVYPSHYEAGNLGVPNPNAMPYETVHRSMLDAKERVAAAGVADHVQMRPWLQDFSWGHPYGPAEVRAQIQATYDAGYKQWLLWNAANVYTEEALEP